MNLVVDIGNSVIKTAVFEGNRLCSTAIISEQELQTIANDQWDGIIVSSVRNNIAIEGALVLSNQTPLPISIDYETPNTLGVDRIAAAVGAVVLFPEQPCLVIDIGTCMTFEYINEFMQYQGGIISPGWKMRLDAMHHLTAKLPQIDKETTNALVGKSTKECMQIGAFNSIIQEINGTIEQYKLKNHDLKVIMCGGDAKTFETKLKERIFAEPNLVLIGLNRILEYNNAK